MSDPSKQLDEIGYVVLPDVIDHDFVAELNGRIDELFEAEGDAAGAEFKQEAGCRFSICIAISPQAAEEYILGLVNNVVLKL